MLSTRMNRWTFAAVTFATLAAPGAVLAQTPDHTADSAAQFPSKSDLKSLTTAGSYLAARHEFDGSRELDMTVAGIAREARHRQCQHRAQPFSARGDQMVGDLGNHARA